MVTLKSDWIAGMSTTTLLYCEYKTSQAFHITERNCSHPHKDQGPAPSWSSGVYVRLRRDALEYVQDMLMIRHHSSWGRHITALAALY